MTETILSVRNLTKRFGGLVALNNCNIDIEENSITGIIGPNGSGKSTILNTTSNLITPKKGSIKFNGEEISNQPTFKRTEIGISHVLERRRVFPHLTVLQNLNLGAYHPKAKEMRQDSLEKIYKIFPKLSQREDQLASTMSGGEQQMLAIARGLMGMPKLLMVDEPFLGLSPMVTKDLINIFKNIVETGISILFVEQNVRLALSMATRGFVLESGRLVISGDSKDLIDSTEVRRVFLGN